LVTFKEIVERRHGEAIKFLFLPKMGLLGSQAGNSLDTREAEIQELNLGPDRNNNQEMLQGPHWIQHGVPVPAQADPEPETPCTKDHCSCPGPVYCQWEQETEVPEPRNAEIATGTQDEATGFQDVGPPPSSVIDSDDNSAYNPWSKGPDPRGRNGDSSDDDYKPDYMTAGNQNGNDQNSQEVHVAMDVQVVGQVFNGFFHTSGMNGNPAVNTTFDLSDLSALEEPPTEAEADPIQETPARSHQFRRFRRFRSEPE
jgi:hypothetical protein